MGKAVAERAGGMRHKRDGQRRHAPRASRRWEDDGECRVLPGDAHHQSADLRGNSQLVERSLKLLSHVHGGTSFVTVRLSGLVHTTDRLAMRAIAVQLAAQGFSTSIKDGETGEGDYVRLSRFGIGVSALSSPSFPCPMRGRPDLAC